VIALGIRILYSPISLAMLSIKASTARINDASNITEGLIFDKETTSLASDLQFVWTN